MIEPTKDGIDHINVYSKGATALGRFLSNFAHSPFEHPEDGHFDSVEGYWYWLSCKDDRLRKLSGFAAKKLGRELKAERKVHDPEFNKRIYAAIDAKLKTNPEMTRQFTKSTLPFKHYYVYGGKAVSGEGQWIMDFLEKHRRAAKEELYWEELSDDQTY